MKRVYQSLEDVLLSKRKIVGECWEWTGGLTSQGYGRITVDKKQTRVHCVAAKLWTKLTGPCILHTCDNRKCFNPQHLFQGTRGDNYRDAVQKGRSTWGNRG